jgi:hypothetical protein
MSLWPLSDRKSRPRALVDIDLDGYVHVYDRTDAVVRPSDVTERACLSSSRRVRNWPRAGPASDYKQESVTAAEQPGSRTAIYEMISRAAYGQVKQLIKFSGGPYVAESEPHSSSPGAGCDGCGSANSAWVALRNVVRV